MKTRGESYHTHHGSGIDEREKKVSLVSNIIYIKSIIKIKIFTTV